MILHSATKSLSPGLATGKRSEPAKEVTVAIIDTGVSLGSNPGDRLIGFKDFVNGRTEAYDDHGQGTHIAGCITCPQGREAQVPQVKLLGADSPSRVVAGIEWAITNRENLKLDVISMSPLGPCDGVHDDAIEKAVQRAIEAGLTVIRPER